jgi:Mg/Co/Ni transporter MgtE
LTLATRFGEKRVGLFLLGLGFAVTVLVVIGFLSGYVEKPVVILFMSIIAWTGIVTLPIYDKKIKLHKSLSEPLIDTQQVACGISLIIFSMSV